MAALVGSDGVQSLGGWDVNTGERQIGLVTVTALVLGNMIGSGVLLLPATLAPSTRIAHRMLTAPAQSHALESSPGQALHGSRSVAKTAQCIRLNRLTTKSGEQCRLAAAGELS